MASGVKKRSIWHPDILAPFLEQLSALEQKINFSDKIPLFALTMMIRGKVEMLRGGRLGNIFLFGLGPSDLNYSTIWLLGKPFVRSHHIPVFYGYFKKIYHLSDTEYHKKYRRDYHFLLYIHQVCSHKMTGRKNLQNRSAIIET